MNNGVCFWHTDKHRSHLQVVCITRHVQITQNKLAYLCNILGDEVGFLPEDKQESFLQDDSIT